MIVVIVALFLSAAVRVVAQVVDQCGSCTTAADCVNCATEVATRFGGHDFWANGAANAGFSCTGGSCFIDLATLTTAEIAECNSNPSSTCCAVGPGDDADSICQSKRCFVTSGCLNRGVCVYGNDDTDQVYENCCTLAGDCPEEPPANIRNDVPVTLHSCFERSCLSGSCSYELIPGCCSQDSDCSSSQSQTAICTNNQCEVFTPVGAVCSSDIDCGSLSNECADATCVADKCVLESRSPLLLGCCNSDAVANCQPNVCQVASLDVCFDTPSPVGGSVFAQGDFTCNFNTLPVEDCCIVDSDCINAGVSCFSGSCNPITNTCDLSVLSFNGEVCCANHDDCVSLSDGGGGMPNPSNACEIRRCDVSATSRFTCTTTSATACSSVTPLSDGLVPLLSVTTDEIGCEWDCADTDVDANNALVVRGTLSSSSTVDRVLYAFDVLVDITTPSAPNSVISVVILSATLVSTDTRLVPVGFFQSTTITVSGDTTTARFSGNPDEFSLFPGEQLEFEVQIVLEDTAIAVVAAYTVVPADVCSLYWLSDPLCSTSTLGSPIYRAPVESSAQLSRIFDDADCPALCDVFQTTTAGSSTGATISATAAPTNIGETTATTVTPAPTPIITASASDSVRTVELSIDRCGDSCDGVFANTLDFSIVETGVEGTGTELYEIAVKVNSAACGFVNIEDVYGQPDVTQSTIVGIVTADEVDLLAVVKFDLLQESIVANPNSNTTHQLVALSQTAGATTPMDAIVRGRLFLDPAAVAACPPESMTFTLIAHKQSAACTAGDVATGLCSASQLGAVYQQTLTLPTLSLTFGEGASDQCEPMCTETVEATAAQTLGAIFTLGCTWDCEGSTSTAEPNVYEVNYCFTPFSIGDSSVALSQLGVELSVNDDSGAKQSLLAAAQAFDVDAIELFFLGDTTLAQLVPLPATFVVVGLGAVGTLEQPFFFSGNTDSCFRIRVPRITSVVAGFSLFDDNNQFDIELFPAVRTVCSGASVAAGSCDVTSVSSDSELLTLFDDNLVRLTQLQLETTPTSVLADTCSPPCKFNAFGEDEIGGYVFYDIDCDGFRILSGEDLSVPSIFVQVVDASTGALIDTAASSNDGLFTFNATQVFAISPSVRFRITLDEFPFNTNVASMGDINDQTSNVFQLALLPDGEQVYVSPAFAATSGQVIRSAGFKPASDEPGDGDINSCTPFVGPFADDSVVLVAKQSSCLACDSEDRFGGECESLRSAGVCEEFETVEVSYSLSNYNDAAESGSSVRIEFDQLSSNFADAHLRCVDAQGFVTTGDASVFVEDQAILVGNTARAAHVVVAYDAIPVGVDVLEFGARFTYCRRGGVVGAPVRANVTATVFGDQCLDLLRRFGTCDSSQPDFRECYNGLTFDSSATTATTTTTGSANCVNCVSVAPPDEAPAPVDQASTALVLGVRTFGTRKQCVSRRTLRRLVCTDTDAAIAECQAAGSSRGSLIAEYTLLNPTSAVASEMGELELKLSRATTNETSPLCRALDPEVRLQVLRDGVVLAPGIVSVDHSDVDASDGTVELVLKLGVLQPGDELTVHMETLECFGHASQDTAVNASATLITDLCTNATLCSQSASIESARAAFDAAQDTPCAILPQIPTFADKRGPGKHIAALFHSLNSTDPLDSTTSESLLVLLYLTVGVILCVLCAACFYFVVSPNLRRSRQRQTRSRRPRRAVERDCDTTPLSRVRL